MGASVFVCRRGGTVITCAATTGYQLEFDARYLWMNLKTIKGCHFANYREAWEANRLVCQGRLHPTMSRVYPLELTGDATYEVHKNRHEGKLGITVLAPHEGLGVRDHELRAANLDRIELFRRHASEPLGDDC
jgi:crotonyl-CoA reductase